MVENRQKLRLTTLNFFRNLAVFGDFFHSPFSREIHVDEPQT